MSEYQERHSVSRLSYPNPTSGSASIKYQLKDDVDVNIKLYDVYGKMIRVLVNKKQEDGSYSFRTDLSGLPDGI